MINSILQAIFNVIFFILRWLGNLLLLPITALLDIFPIFDNYITDLYRFLDDYLFRGIAFTKQLFLNLTGFPQALITITVNFTVIYFTTIAGLKSLTFIVNLYRTYKGGTTK